MHKDVELFAADLIFAAHHAGVIEGVKSLQLKRNLISNNKISSHGDFAIHYAGMLGEIAVGKALGITPSTHITFGGDGNVDMSVLGQSIQIKTSTHKTTPPPRYLIFNSAEDFSTDWAISCSIQSVCVVRIHGFISKKKFLKNLKTTDFGYGERFCVDECHLSSIEKFKQAAEKFSEMNSE